MTSTDTDLLTLSQIATRAGVTPAAVSNWRRRYPDTFPAPVRDDLFDSAAIDQWLWDRKKRTTRPKEVPGRGLAWELVSAARGELEASTTVTVAASLVTLCAFDRDRRMDDLRPADLAAAGTRAERVRDLPAGALSIPLAPARGLANDTLQQMVHAVRQALTANTAEHLFDEILDRLDGSPGTAPPQPLVDFLIALAPPYVQSVLDPACGTGALLQAATQELSIAQPMGYDTNATAWGLCAQRLSLHGMPTHGVRHGDFFSETPRDIDLVLCTPPLGSHFQSKSPAAVLEELGAVAGSIKNHGDFAWLFAARNALAATGTAIVVTAAGSTFAGGAAQSLRHELLRSGSVAAVIALPHGLGAGVTISLTAWVLQPAGTTAGHVLLVNANPGGDTRRLDPALLRAAAREYQAWRTNPDTYQSVPGLSADVPVLELLAGDVALTPAKWTEVPVDPETALKQARTALQQFTAATQALAEVHPPAIVLSRGPDVDLVSLHDLARQGRISLQRPRHINRDAVQDAGDHPYVTGVNEDGPRIVGYLNDIPDDAVVTQPGDVILSTLGRVRATVDRHGGHVLGSAVWLIRSQPDDPALQPDLLALLLASPRIAEQAVGTTVQRLRHPKDVTIPLLPANTGPTAATWAQATAQARLRAEQLSRAAAVATSSLAAALDAGVVVRGQAMNQALGARRRESLGEHESGDKKRGRR